MSQANAGWRLLRPLSSSGGDDDSSGAASSESQAPPPEPNSATPTAPAAAAEAAAFVGHINAELGDDPHVQHLGFPLDPFDLFRACADGIIFCKLINLASPGTIDERAVNVPKAGGGSLSFYHKIENNNLAIHAARAIGCIVTNVGAQDLVAGRPSLVLGLLWQVIKVQLLASVALREGQTPGLARLLELAAGAEGEDMFVGFDFAAAPELFEEDGGVGGKADKREEGALRMWINSLGLTDEKGGALFVRSLFGEEMADGVVLLRAMDAIEPGVVPWQRVNLKKAAHNRYKKIENANLVIATGKEMGLVLVNFGGPDLVDRNKKLLLAITGQIMRRYTLGLLRRLGAAGGSEAVTEEEVLAWADATVRQAANDRDEGAGAALALPLCASFRDPSLADSRFLLALIAAIEPRAVDWGLVTEGRDELDRQANAQYAISLARRLDACVFISPEDIVEARARPIMLFLAALWACALEKKRQQQSLHRPPPQQGAGKKFLVPLAETPPTSSPPSASVFPFSPSLAAVRGSRFNKQPLPASSYASR